MTYESKRQRPLARTQFVRRLLGHAALVAILLLASIAIGMSGYMGFEGLSAIDAFVEACMLLGGMGPVHAPVTEAGKLFAGLFALYGGLIFIVVAAVMISPVLHRLLHRFHFDDSSRDD